MSIVMCVNCRNNVFLNDLDIAYKHVTIADIEDLDNLININLVLFYYEPSRPQDFASLQLLKITPPSIPIVMLRSRNDEALTRWALQLRVSSYLLVPDELIFLKNIMKAAISSKSGIVSNSNPDRNYATSIKTDFSKKTKHLKTHNAVEAIASKYAEKFNVKYLAERCHMSKRSFSTYFKLEHGINVRDYIKYYRLFIAKQLLTDTGSAIQQVAYSVGYSDASLFNRIFKDTEKMTPKEYRLIIRQQNGVTL